MFYIDFLKNQMTDGNDRRTFRMENLEPSKGILTEDITNLNNCVQQAFPQQFMSARPPGGLHTSLDVITRCPDPPLLARAQRTRRCPLHLATDGNGWATWQRTGNMATDGRRMAWSGAEGKLVVLGAW